MDAALAWQARQHSAQEAVPPCGCSWTGSRSFHWRGSSKCPPLIVCTFTCEAASSRLLGQSNALQLALYLSLISAKRHFVPTPPLVLLPLQHLEDQHGSSARFMTISTMRMYLGLETPTF